MSEAIPAAGAVDELDDFAKVFGTLSELKEGEAVPADLKAPPAPTKTPEEIAAEEAAAKAAADAAAADTTNEDGLPPELTPEEKIAADEAAAAAAKEKGSPQPAPAPADDRLEAALDKLADRLSPKQPKTEERQPPEQMLPQLTTEEAQAYAKYVQEFPEIAAAETAIRRLEIKQAMTVVMKLFEDRIGSLVQPLNQVTTYSHKNQLVAAIPDYSDVRAPVIKWVDEQPPYLQAAYKQVVAEGSVEEIKDLVDRWRKETGAAAPAATPPATPAKTDPKLPDAAKQAAERLAPVGTKRSTVVAAPSKEDFDGAFDTFAKDPN